MFEAVILGEALKFETAAGLFSPAGPDAGTLAMLARTELGPDDKVLDLGCGYGLVGMWAATIVGPSRVWMIDSEPHAADVARRNLALNGLAGAEVLVSDGVSALKETGFTRILCHPPYHSDFAVAKAFIEKGFNRLVLGGRMLMVTRREDWYRNKLTAIFGGVKVFPDGGYVVFEAEKRSASYARKRP
jgi:16S rRNA (guanine1207-N2)-methyltransferase